MTPPKCNICGHAHWKHHPHVFGADVQPEPKKTAKRQPASPDKAPAKPKRDRRKYQRDLMRKRRAEGKT